MSKNELWSPHQVRRFNQLKHDMRVCEASWVVHAKTIHAEGLFKQTHKSWHAFMAEEFGFSQEKAYAVLEASSLRELVHLEISKYEETASAEIPEPKESHAKELRGLPDEDKAAVFVEAAKTAPKDTTGKPKVTAKHVRDTRRTLEELPVAEAAPGNVHPATIVLDNAGRKVPSGLAECHGLAAAINAEASKLDPIKRAVVAMKDQPGGEFLPVSEVEDGIKRLKKLITDARYYTECPRCRGQIADDCGRCKGHGFIPQSAKGQLSADEKEWIG